MSFFSFLKRRKVAKVRAEESIDVDAGQRSLPTIKFDERLITESVKCDLADTIRIVEDIPDFLKKGLYEAALASAPQRDLGRLNGYILSLRLNSMTNRRSAEIVPFIANRTTSFIETERRLSLGIEFAVWMHAGAPCSSAIDHLHRQAHGKKYPLRTGLLMDGRYMSPGRDSGCKCIAKPIIAGFS